MDELGALGLEDFVDDYRHALLPEPIPQAPAPEPEPVQFVEPEMPVSEPDYSEPPKRRLPKMKMPPMRVNPADLRNGAVLPPPGMEPEAKPQRTQPTVSPIIEREDVPPPGWELDQLPDELVGEEDPMGSADDAVMAATYGLAPPSGSPSRCGG